MLNTVSFVVLLSYFRALTECAGIATEYIRILQEISPGLSSSMATSLSAPTLTVTSSGSGSLSMVELQPLASTVANGAAKRPSLLSTSPSHVPSATVSPVTALTTGSVHPHPAFTATLLRSIAQYVCHFNLLGVELVGRDKSVAFFVELLRLYVAHIRTHQERSLRAQKEKEKERERVEREREREQKEREKHLPQSVLGSTPSPSASPMHSPQFSSLISALSSTPAQPVGLVGVPVFSAKDIPLPLAIHGPSSSPHHSG